MTPRKTGKSRERRGSIPDSLNLMFLVSEKASSVQKCSKHSSAAVDYKRSHQSQLGLCGRYNQTRWAQPPENNSWLKTRHHRDRQERLSIPSRVDIYVDHLHVSATSEATRQKSTSPTVHVGVVFHHHNSSRCGRASCITEKGERGGSVMVLGWNILLCRDTQKVFSSMFVRPN